MIKPIIYISGPYTHDALTVRDAREKQLTQAATIVAQRGLVVFSPITHTVPMERRGLTLDHEGWMDFDRPFMKLCTHLLVVTIYGWQESRGVRQEVGTFQAAGKPVDYRDIHAIDEWAKYTAACNGYPWECDQCGETGLVSPPNKCQGAGELLCDECAKTGVMSGGYWFCRRCSDWGDEALGIKAEGN